VAGQAEHSAINSSLTGAHACSGVGRIVEVRVRRLVDVADVESLNAAVFAAMRRAGPGAIVCADYRRVSPLQYGIADVWARAIRKANGSIARSAILVDPSNTMFNLQFERIVQCAGNPARRFFTGVDDVRRWLDVDLTEPERGALQAFLSVARDR
jgi:hypothetical protein